VVGRGRRFSLIRLDFLLVIVIIEKTKPNILIKMKKSIVASIAVVALGSVAFGQGVIFDNIGNSGVQNAASNGRVYNQDGSLFDGLDYNLGVTVLVSSTGANGSYNVFQTFTPGNDPKGYTGADVGQFQLGAANLAVDLPGISAGGTAFLEFMVWSAAGNGSGTLAASYNAAVLAGDPTATVFFSTGTSNPAGSPPVPASNLTSMPSFTLVATPVPEPTTLALAGLGGFGMLMAFRRKKA
jgi:hypothetical protein